MPPEAAWPKHHRGASRGGCSLELPTQPVPGAMWKMHHRGGDPAKVRRYSVHAAACEAVRQICSERASCSPLIVIEGKPGEGQHDRVSGE